MPLLWLQMDTQRYAMIHRPTFDLQFDCQAAGWSLPRGLGSVVPNVTSSASHMVGTVVCVVNAGQCTAACCRAMRLCTHMWLAQWST